MANSTAITIIERAWNLANVDGTTVSEPGIQLSAMLKSLHSINNDWRRAFRRGGEPPVFMKKEEGIDLVADTQLNGGVAENAISVVLADASGLETSGAVVIWDDGQPDTVEYTGVSTNTLTGVTGVDWDHEDEDGVQVLYALPSNFGSFRATDDSPYGVSVNGVPYQPASGKPTAGTFGVYDNGTTKYLWLPQGAAGTAFITYNKNSTTIDDSADQVDWEPQYDDYGAYRLAAIIFGIRGKFDFKVDANNEARRLLREALKDRNIGKYVHVRPFKQQDIDRFSLTHQE